MFTYLCTCVWAHMYAHTLEGQGLMAAAFFNHCGLLVLGQTVLKNLEAIVLAKLASQRTPRIFLITISPVKRLQAHSNILSKWVLGIQTQMFMLLWHYIK